MKETIISPLGEWLNQTFYNFDLNILTNIHNLGINPNGLFQNLINIISFLVDDGKIFFLIATILLLFKKTRKIGVGLMGALGFSAVFGLIDKSIISRPRPYVTYDQIKIWFDELGLELSKSNSFPSGHTTMTMAAATAFFVYFNKKYSWSGYILVLFVAFSRLECLYHYPTDVIAGMITGLIGAICGLLTTKFIFYILNKHKKIKLFDFALNFNCFIPKK